MTGKLLTIEEASAVTRLPVSTLRHMRQHGKGPQSGKIGRRVFYREADLDAWVAAQFAQNPSAA